MDGWILFNSVLVVINILCGMHDALIWWEILRLQREFAVPGDMTLH